MSTPTFYPPCPFQLFQNEAIVGKNEKSSRSLSPEKDEVFVGDLVEPYKDIGHLTFGKFKTAVDDLFNSSTE